MNGQEVLFDLAEGERRRAKALELVDRDEAWHSRARGWVLGLASGHVFTTDDIARACGYPACDPRAFGALMRWLAMRNVIRKANSAPVKSERASCHARPITVWERA